MLCGIVGVDVDCPFILKMASQHVAIRFCSTTLVGELDHSTLTSSDKEPRWTLCKTFFSLYITFDICILCFGYELISVSVMFL